MEQPRSVEIGSKSSMVSSQSPSQQLQQVIVWLSKDFKEDQLQRIKLIKLSRIVK